MYYFIVSATMLVLPIASIGIDLTRNPGQDFVLVLGKWFVFWALGVRLGLAGLRQIIQPRYTAQRILGLTGDEALLVVRELGFANVALAASALVSVVASAWTVPCALTGGIFYGLAGINHLMHAKRNRLENTAMVSDLLAALVLLGYCARISRI